jgi:lipase ATG15
MITGAQMEIPSIGLSGPNNMISRNTFDPPISIEALNKYTFNIVPDRDPVPRIDDLAQNYQPIDCRADPNKPVDCHSAKRSVCEILFTCGSSGRPVPCFCVNDYGYEEPASIHGKSFSDYCTDNDSLQMHFHNVNQLFQTLSK